MPNLASTSASFQNEENVAVPMSKVWICTETKGHTRAFQRIHSLADVLFRSLRRLHCLCACYWHIRALGKRQEQGILPRLRCIADCTSRCVIVPIIHFHHLWSIIGDKGFSIRGEGFPVRGVLLDGIPKRTVQQDKTCRELFNSIKHVENCSTA